MCKMWQRLQTHLLNVLLKIKCNLISQCVYECFAEEINFAYFGTVKSKNMHCDLHTGCAYTCLKVKMRFLRHTLKPEMFLCVHIICIMLIPHKQLCFPPSDLQGYCYGSYSLLNFKCKIISSGKIFI